MREIKGTTKLCGLIGNPVEHSISPIIHNNLSKLKDIDMVYTTFRVEEEDVDRAIKGAYALNIVGLNVTVPHKQRVMESLVEIDPLAKAIGAVNTLVRVKDGFKGYNTDILGLERELKDEGLTIKDKTCIILGAGGAARAITFLCASREAKKVYVINRSLDKADSIKDAVNTHFNKSIVETLGLDEYEKISDNDCLCIQCTSVGLYPKVDDVIISDEAFYKKISAGVDIIYNPSRTRFMKLCNRAGKKAYNGLKMLLYQGVCAYELWTNTTVSASECQKIYNVMKANMASNIILIGFMGSGKTTFGKWISKHKGMDFVDTDDYIEAKENMTINEIFETKGEEYFRELETKALMELQSKLNNCVISVGGGLVCKVDNQKLLASMGKIVYLDTPKHELIKRLSSSTNRPLLKDVNLSDKIDELMAKREEIYKKVSTVRVDTANRDFEDMYKDIINS